jgi:uncharacterized protein (DUF1778 family)
MADNNAAKCSLRAPHDGADALRISREDQEHLARSLTDPPEPTAALRRAFDRRRELLGDGDDSACARSAPILPW